MPNYDYHCHSCGKTHEAFQKITEEPLKECPLCHNPTLERGIGGGLATFCFKGKGFYITDYKEGAKDSSSSGGCGCPGSHTCK